ncbi:MAG: hypothetical protein H0T62_14080 [Parachlamydiaceae bacterium]|nr:hypothetical protein [Parachlamydiaceae bacterium]
MLQRFGKQLTVAIVGAGPIGLSAAINFYKLGFDVKCYEKRGFGGEEGFAERPQPFSLQRQSYAFLQHVGLSANSLLKSFGYSLSPSTIDRSGNRTAAEFLTLASPLMKEAKKDCIGKSAVDYLPQSMSITVQSVQRLLAEVIFGHINTLDKDQLTVQCYADFLESTVDENGRHILTIKTKTGREYVSPDVIYNASAGRVNEILGFETKKIATYYGMGAFFQRPSKPSHETIKELSRAVRVFCSFDNEQPIYCNMELNQDEYEKMEDFDISKEPLTSRDEILAKKIVEGKLPGVISQMMRDIGLSSPYKAFRVPVDLQHAKQAALSSPKKDNEIVPQLIFCGGDSVLKPHFITASGANFGLLGLSELDRLLKEWLRDEVTSTQVIDEYNSMCNLLQKQSNQVILELFSRDLVKSRNGK